MRRVSEIRYGYRAVYFYFIFPIAPFSRNHNLYIAVKMCTRYIIIIIIMVFRRPDGKRFSRRKMTKKPDGRRRRRRAASGQ